MYTVIVYQDKDTADRVAHEICVTPSGIFLHCDPDAPAGQNTVTYAVAADGRCAQSFPAGEADRDWLELRYGGLTGVQILDALPGDWVWPNSP